MITYLKVVLSILALVATFAFVVPFAVSQANTALVLLGFGLLVTVPALVFWVWSDEIQSLIDRVQVELDKR